MSSETLTYEIKQAVAKTGGYPPYRMRKKVQDALLSRLKIAHRVYVYKRLFNRYDLVAVVYPQKNVFFSMTSEGLKKHYTITPDYADERGENALLNTITSRRGNVEWAMRFVFDYGKPRSLTRQPINRNKAIIKTSEVKMTQKTTKKRKTLKNYKHIISAVKLKKWIKRTPPHKRKRNPGVGTNTRFVGVIADGIYLYKTMPDSAGDKIKKGLKKMRKITGGAVKLHRTPRNRNRRK